MEVIAPYLLDGELFSIRQLGSVAGSILMYAVKITPVLKLKIGISQEHIKGKK